jgi:plastocyanin
MNRCITRLPPRFLIPVFVLFAGMVLTTLQVLAATPARSIPVQLGDYRFTPDTITVQSGETIRLELTNTDKVTPHNFTLKAEAAGLDVDVDVNAGKTEMVDITPLTPGSYEFYCNKKLLFMKSHRDHGMEGTLIVAPASPE